MASVSLAGPSFVLGQIGRVLRGGPRTPGAVILGPFHGKVVCQAIKIGKGVCGTVAQQGGRDC
jgi:hypothetical protein